MKLHFCFTAVSLSCSLIMIGCKPSQMPEGMPKPIKGVEVTVTQEGAPLADAAVTFVAEDGSTNKWFVRGKTGANGVAKMMTYGKFEGAPAGKFKVVITKREETPSKITPPTGDDPNAVAAYQEAVEKEVRPLYDLVDPVYSSPKTTKVEVDISSGSLKHAIDVGKAVRVEMK